jgi:hypothetical protein
MKICITYGELKAAGFKVNANGIEQIMGDQMPEMDFAYLADYAPFEYDDERGQVYIVLPPIDGTPIIQT